jgi:hypothetical protein
VSNGDVENIFNYFWQGWFKVKKLPFQLHPQTWGELALGLHFFVSCLYHRLSTSRKMHRLLLKTCFTHFHLLCLWWESGDGGLLDDQGQERYDIEQIWVCMLDVTEQTDMLHL